VASRAQTAERLWGHGVWPRPGLVIHDDARSVVQVHELSLFWSL